MCKHFTLLKNPFLFICCSFFIFLLLVSCTPDPIEVSEIPDVKPEIVVSSQILPGQILVVWLSKTFGSLNVSGNSNPEAVLQEIAVKDAVVTISGPTRTDTLIYVDGGLYSRPGILFETGTTYELRVKSPSLGEVKATTTAQPQVPFKSLNGTIRYDIEDDTLMEISYAVQDPIEPNRYMINAQKIRGDTADLLRQVINPTTSTFLLKDTEFNGLALESHFDYSPDDFQAGDTIMVSLSNISEEYYLFMELRMENRLNFTQFLSDPINYPTNVEGGKGFFNLYIPDFRTLVVE